MKKEVIQKLNNINKAFYKKVSEDFDDSRQYYWTGWEKLVPYLKDDMKILDIGCGNGRFYEFIKSKGFNVEYTGADVSVELLNLAKERYPAASWKELDIVENYAELTGNYDLIVAFGVFHHIPSFELRKSIADHLVNTGKTVVISFWQFPKLKNLMNRQAKFNDFGIENSQIEKGDYLLDWQRGGEAVRFCHHVDETEVMKLLPNAEIFYADGKNQETNLYASLP
jgi:tRNA (uracil-5-)-methyltransferase TRM9